MTAVAAGIMQLGGLTPSLTAVQVNVAGTSTPASLYTDASSGTAAANPLTSDDNGDVTFYAIPGSYDLIWTEIDVINKLTVTIRTGGTGKITFTPGVPACAGAVGDIAFNQSASTTTMTNVYKCTVAGAAGSATWVGIA